MSYKLRKNLHWGEAELNPTYRSLYSTVNRAWLGGSLPDTKVAKYLIEYVFGADFTDDSLKS